MAQMNPQVAPAQAQAPVQGAPGAGGLDPQRAQILQLVLSDPVMLQAIMEVVAQAGAGGGALGPGAPAPVGPGVESQLFG